MGFTEDGYFDDESSGRKLFSDECKSVLGRFIIGERDEAIARHLDSCRVCSILIFGDEKVMPTSIFDDLVAKHLFDELRAKDKLHVPPSEEVMEHGAKVMLHEFHVTVNTARVHDEQCQKSDRSNSGSGTVDTQLVNAAELNAATVPTADSMTRRSRVSRRRAVAWLTAASIAILGGSLRFFHRDAEANRSPKSATTGIDLTQARTKFLARWDAAYQGSNVAAVRAQMARSTPTDLITAMEWIAERRVAVLYPDLVGYLVDPNLSIRRAAIMNLVVIPPIALKPILASIQAARSIETDLPNQSTLDELIKAVMKA